MTLCIDVVGYQRLRRTFLPPSLGWNEWVLVRDPRWALLGWHRVVMW